MKAQLSLRVYESTTEPQPKDKGTDRLLPLMTLEHKIMLASPSYSKFKIHKAFTRYYNITISNGVTVIMLKNLYNEYHVF